LLSSFEELVEGSLRFEVPIEAPTNCNKNLYNKTIITEKIKKHNELEI
jgi:hypothetical protein